MGIFSVCRCCDSSYECGSIYMDRTGSSPAADSKRGLSSYVYIYQNYFAGIMFTFLYNYFSCLLRAIGNSVVPLWFLAVSSVLNIILDIWFVAGMNRGVGGAAEATVIAQAVSGIGIAGYTILKVPF